jgi:hypothetical protein
MPALIDSLYRNVQTICVNGDKSDLISYLSHDGLVLIRQLLQTEIQVRYIDVVDNG